jgi:hypothetical protein
LPGHEAHARDAGDVGDLVRVGDDGRHPARHDGRRELRRHAQAALDVHVGVDQPRREVRAAEVDPLGAA